MGGGGGGEVDIGVQSEGGQGEPGTATLACMALRLGQRDEARRPHVDRQSAAGGRAGPGRGEELVGGGDQLVGSGPCLLGVQDEEPGTGGEHVGDLLHPIHQDRAEGLHPVGGDAVGDPQQQVPHSGKLLRPRAGTFAHCRRQEDLAAGRGVEAVGCGVQGTLIGDGEVADVVDLVAEQVHAHRMRLGGREHVEDAAADGELTALLHHVHAHVGGVHEVALDVFERVGLPHRGTHRPQLAQALRDRLQQGPHGHQQHVHRGLGLGVRDAAQGRQALGDRVRTWREPLVREGLPGRELGEVLGAHHRGQRGAQVLGGAGGGGDHDQGLLGAGAAREICDEEREQAGGGDDAAALSALGALEDEVADGAEVASGGELVQQGPQRRVRSGGGGGGGLRGHRTSRVWKRCWAAVRPSRMTASTASAASEISRSRVLRSVAENGAST